MYIIIDIHHLPNRFVYKKIKNIGGANIMAYYAVRIGRNPGIYTTWDECKKEVIGFDGAVYKKFESEEDADAFMNVEMIQLSLTDIMALPAFAFVDGSFNTNGDIVGAGGFMITTKDGKVHDRYMFLTKCDCDEEMKSMRNIAGEITAARIVITAAIDAGIKDLTILYDYQGIENWATGLWKTNKTGTKEYQKYCLSVKDKIALHFIKVQGHTDIVGNEIADRFAKYSSDIMSAEDVYTEVTKLDSETGFIDSDVLKTMLNMDDADFKII